MFPIVYEEYGDFFTEQDQLFKEAERNAAEEFEELFPATSEVSSLLLAAFETYKS